MTTAVKIGERLVGPGHPCFIIGEIGINHNGELDTALQLIDATREAGCDAAKFQKRTPEICVPSSQRETPRETPWGVMSYLDYRRRIELGGEEYSNIDEHCNEKKFPWLASCWDEPSVDFVEQFKPLAYKIASACLTDDNLLRHHRKYKRPIILSTGMSTIEQIDHAIEVLGTNDLIILHCTSAYPASADELNLKMIHNLQERYMVPVGYSGHEIGLQTTVAAVAIGACLVERHITLSRAMWGSDQSASVEPHGFARLVRDIRAVEAAMGDGTKRIYNSEIPLIERLRRK